MIIKPKKDYPSDPVTVEEERPNPIMWMRIRDERPSMLYTFALFAVFLLFHRAVNMKEELDIEMANDPKLSITDSAGDSREKLDKICKNILTNYERICSPKGEPFNFHCVTKLAMGDDGQVSDPSEFIAVICARHKLTDSLEHL